MWIVPSRNRPQLVRDMFKSAPPITPGIVAIDTDQKDLYKGVKLPMGWRLDISPKRFYVQKHNEIFSRFPNEPWYGSINDDMVTLTPGWDRLLIEAAGAWGIAYADDAHTRRAGCIVFGGELVRACGFMFIPAVHHFYSDSAAELMAREFGFAGMVKGCVVEHRHYSNKRNPGKFDKTSKGRPHQSAEKPYYEKWLKSDWPWLKERLKRTIPAGFNARSHNVEMDATRQL